MSPISFIFDSIFCACVSVSVCVCVCVCRCVCVCVSAFLSLIWGDFLIGRAVEGAEGRRVGGGRWWPAGATDGAGGGPLRDFKGLIERVGYLRP